MNIYQPYCHFSAKADIWDSAFAFNLPTISSKANFRRSSSDNHVWKQHQAFQNEVRNHARQALPEKWELGNKTAKPNDRPAIVATILASTVLDADNVFKSILDSIQGIAYYTDTVVRGVTSNTIRSSQPLTPGIAAWVGLANLGLHPSASQVADAKYFLEKMVIEASNITASKI